MMSMALIVFREMLEIALILGVLAAATRGVWGRGRWFALGIGGGILAASSVALLADRIAESAEGMGQDIFNALVLCTAALLIGWTVVWMRAHGAGLQTHLKEVGEAVSRKQRPLITLSIVIALAILREGSEIILFTYGALASGEAWTPVLLGTLAGTAAGGLTGTFLYMGLIRVSTRRLFTLTSWMLIFLAAGMASQAMGFLQAADIVPVLTASLWDTSRLLPENSLVGRLFQALFGYCARPTGMQVVIYTSTALLITLALKLAGQTQRLVPAAARRKAGILLTALAAGLLTAGPAHATKKVYSPLVEKGELEVEVRGSYDMDSRDSKDGAQKQKYAIGYGFTDWYFSEIYGEIERGAADGHFTFTSVEWENRFQLTEQGEYILDAGLYFAYEASLEDKKADKIEAKILLEKSLHRFTHTANLIFKKEILGAKNLKNTEGGLAWGSRWRWREYLEPGVEWHGHFGEWNDLPSLSQQTHQVGPVFYGKVGAIKYDIGYLFGVSDPAPEGMLKWILEIEL